MRTVVSSLFVVCVLLVMPGHAAEPEAPKTADEAAVMWKQAVGDRWPDRWQGRKHYLFDDSNPAETTASSRASETTTCADEPVRVRRADGSTAVERINRCR
jgi:hypothetical protein